MTGNGNANIDRDLAARLIGRLEGLSVLLRLLLARQPDLEDIARQADEDLMRQAQAASDAPSPFDLEIEEEARLTVAAILADARAAR